MEKAACYCSPIVYVGNLSGCCWITYIGIGRNYRIPCCVG